jgi:hypothetical protein
LELKGCLLASHFEDLGQGAAPFFSCILSRPDHPPLPTARLPAQGDLCADRNRSERCCTEMTVDEAEHHYLHASPQANCFTTLDGRLALDWLGRVENFEDDLAELLRILNSRPGVPKIPARPPRKANYNASPCEPGGGSSQLNNQAHRRLAWQVRNGTANPCDKMELFRGRHAACYTGVTSFFQEDIALLM